MLQVESMRRSFEFWLSDPDIPWRHHYELVEMAGVLGQNGLQECNPDVDRNVAEAEQDDAGVRQSISEDKIAEVLVVGEDDAPLVVSDFEDGSIGVGMRIIVAHRGSIVTAHMQVSG